MSRAYNQMPDSKVLEADESVSAHVPKQARARAEPPGASLADVALAELSASPPQVLPRGLQALRSTSGFDAARSRIVTSRPLALELPGNCGVTVTGTHVVSATVGGGGKASI